MSSALEAALAPALRTTVSGDQRRLARLWVDRLTLDDEQGVTAGTLFEQMSRMLPPLAEMFRDRTELRLRDDEGLEERLALIGREHARRRGSLRALMGAFEEMGELLGSASEDWVEDSPPAARTGVWIGRATLQMAEIAVSAFMDAQNARHPEERAQAGRSAFGAQRMLAVGTPEQPLAVRLRAGIASAMHYGLLQAGDRLPSVRSLADAAGVDHRAVATAYRVLMGAGIVEIRDRQGVFLAPPPAPPSIALGETAAWAREVLTQAASLRIRAPQVPGVLERAVQTPLRCLCVESVEDERVALAEEAGGQWGMTAIPLACEVEDVAAISAAAQHADLILTTTHLARPADAASRATGKPCVVVGASTTFVETVMSSLARGPLTVLVVDPAYVDRLRVLPHADRLVVHLVDGVEPGALADPRPVLATSAARQALAGRPLRTLLAPSEFLSIDCAPHLATQVVARGLAAPTREPK